MKIVNKTGWNTNHLRAIARKVAAMLPTRHKCRRLTFNAAKQQNFSSGWCYSKSACTVSVPKGHGGVLPPKAKLDVAVIIAHELYHTTGPGGRSDELWMRKSAMYGRPNTDEGKQKQRELYAWLVDMPLERREAKKLPTAKKPSKLEHYTELLTRWERKAKLAKTKIVKYRQRIKYHQKKAAARCLPRE